MDNSLERLKREKNDLLIENGYGISSHLIYSFEYSNLPVEQQAEYIFDENLQAYVKPEKVYDANPQEFNLIWQLNIHKKLKLLESHLKVIKGCVLFFVILTCISMFITFIAYLNLNAIIDTISDPLEETDSILDEY